jgi:hypothetical protein
MLGPLSYPPGARGNRGLSRVKLTHNLVMIIHDHDTMVSRENLGMWLPDNEGHVMSLFSRAFAAGRQNKVTELKSAMSSL